MTKEKIKQLFTGDLDGKTDAEVRNHLIKSFEVSKEDLGRFDILIAYETEGYSAESFLLLRERETGKLFENHASHCSCYGFEDQFEPDETTIQYLKSDKFHFATGDDLQPQHHEFVVREFLKTLEA